MNKLFVILDANAIVHRVYHALPRLTDPQGNPVQALYGLANIVLKIIKEFQPDYLVACFDRPEPTFRHKLFKEYKITRPKTPDELVYQIKRAKEIFEGFNVKTLELAGFEADDLIGFLKEKAKEKENLEILIATGDLDTLQLVDERTKVLTMKKGISETVIYGDKEVFQRFQISPSFLADYKALVGDPSDNIPGIKGIGPKSAVELINQYGSIEEIIKKAKDNLLPEELAKKILANQEKLLLGKTLALIRKDLNLKIDLEDFRYSGFDKEKLKKIFQELGFRSLIERLGIEAKTLFDSMSLKVATLEKKKLQDLLAQKEKIYFLVGEGKFWFNFDGKIFCYPFEREILISLLCLSNLKVSYDFKSLFKKLFSYQNFQYDSNYFDVKIACWLTRPGSADYSLERIIAFALKKEVQPDLANFVYLLPELHQALEKEIENQQLEKVFYQIEIPLVPILASMEFWGIKVDLEKFKHFRQFLKEQLEELKEKIFELTQTQFNLNSPKALREVLFEKLKLPKRNLKKTPGGEISTESSELEKIKDKHPAIPLILKFRELSKLLTTYLEKFPKFIGADGRIHTIFEQTGTSTGRLSSKEPNLQNIPGGSEGAKIFKSAFLAEKGFLLVSFDYSQMELRLAAHLSEDPSMKLAFKNKIDIHNWTAKMIFGQTNEELRKKAKVFNFGIIYGMSTKGFAQRLNISLKEAKQFMTLYFQKFPGLARYLKDVKEKAKIQGYVETLFGRKRFLPELVSGSYREVAKAERIAVNLPIQGLAADLIKLAMIKADKFLKDKKFYPYQARLILQIHDELIFEVEEKIVSEIIEPIKKIMENIYPLDVPLEVEVKIGENLNNLKKLNER